MCYSTNRNLSLTGIGYNGADVSSLYGNMTSLGANANHKTAIVADDFTLTANTVIDEIDVYAYQSFYIGENRPSKSVRADLRPFAVRWRHCIWGSDTANVPSVVEFSGIYRVGADVTARDRAIYKVTASIHTILPAHLLGSRVVSEMFRKYLAPPRTLPTPPTPAMPCNTAEGWQPWIDAGSAGTMGLPMTIRGIYKQYAGIQYFP